MPHKEPQKAPQKCLIEALYEIGEKCLTIMEYTIHYDDSSFYIISFLDRAQAARIKISFMTYDITPGVNIDDSSFYII